nr:hypothetical protein [Candidatus Sigynarchaeum springense]
MTDDYLRQLERINARTQQLQNDPERRAANDRWRENFLNSLQAIKSGQERLAVASGGIDSITRRMKGMGLKEQICNMLGMAKQNFCGENPPYPKLCAAIDAAASALGCQSTPEPPQGCSITGCDPGYYCDPAQNICLIKKGSNESCTVSDECSSGVCEDYTCL